VRSDILASPGTLASGSLDGSSTLAVGATAVASGGSDIASALADAFSNNAAFVAFGKLGATKSTFSDYVGAIVGDVATTATKATNAATSKDTTLQSLVGSFSGQSGVNIDQEEATLVDLQNSYAASAKIVSTVQAMFQSLLAAVQA
jgi:flagellar hook-associated protein 1 FlgK